MLSKRWDLKPPASPEHLRQYERYKISAVLAQILCNRGFNDPRAAHDFLRAETYASNPFSRETEMKGINGGRGAVARLRQAIDQKQPIIVYGDFDADGVTSTVLLVETLRALYRFRHVKCTQEEVERYIKPYIPRRVDEGYGLNSPALRKLAQAGAKVIVTVDCGIRSVEEVADGKTTGLDIIITDHHSIGPEIPDAFAVINPKQADCKYPEKMLAGVGVAYRLAEALVKAVMATKRNVPPPIVIEDLLDLVAIGTVADLAPLNSAENRALVWRGLKVINGARRPGVRALLEVAGIKPGTVSAMNIGYVLGPRINAAGRLKSAMTAYHLLMTRDEGQAAELAQELQALNVDRQDLTRAAQEKIRVRIQEEYVGDVPLIFAGDRDFQPGIVGLVAGRLVEEYFRPAVVMELGEEESRASCRSIPQFDITRALDQCADMLVRHGGHAQAAGFTVVNQNIPALKQRLTELAAASLSGQELLPTLDIDAEVNVNQLSENLVRELEQLEPTGHLNSAPVLMARNLRVLEWRTVGKESNHLKLKLARAGHPPLDAIGFSLGEWAQNMPERIDAVFQLEINEWNGHRSLQLNLQDIRPAEAETRS